MRVNSEPGWEGMFYRDQVEGAIANGKRIEKSSFEPGDSTPLGGRGTVLGSWAVPEEVGDHVERLGIVRAPILYWVEWDHAPRKAVMVTSTKIAEIIEETRQ